MAWLSQAGRMMHRVVTGGGVPANAIRQRDNDPIKDRSGAFIEVRS